MLVTLPKLYLATDKQIFDVIIDRLEEIPPSVLYLPYIKERVRTPSRVTATEDLQFAQT